MGRVDGPTRVSEHIGWQEGRFGGGCLKSDGIGGGVDDPCAGMDQVLRGSEGEGEPEQLLIRVRVDRGMSGGGLRGARLEGGGGDGELEEEGVVVLELIRGGGRGGADVNRAMGASVGWDGQQTREEGDGAGGDVMDGRDRRGGGRMGVGEEVEGAEEEDDQGDWMAGGRGGGGGGGGGWWTKEGQGG